MLFVVSYWKYCKRTPIIFLDDYNIARKKLKIAEATSNLESDEEVLSVIKRRQKTKTQRLIESSDDEEGEIRKLPKPPTIKIKKPIKENILKTYSSQAGWYP